MVVRIRMFNAAEKAQAMAADQEALIARKQAEDVKDQVSSETLRLQRSLRQLAEAKEVARLEHELAQSDVEAAQARLQAGTTTIKNEKQATGHEHETYIKFLGASFTLHKKQIEIIRSSSELQHLAIAPRTTTTRS